MMQQIAKVLKLPAAYFYTTEDELAQVIKIYGQLSTKERRELMSKNFKDTTRKLYQHIVISIRDSIMGEQLRFGDRLLSLRKMSDLHRVSVGTVLNAT